MADVQCGKFELIRQDPETGSLTFRAKLIPAPSAQWSNVFDEYQASERALGNLAVARIRGDVIEFEATDNGAKAAAEVIRRCVERTNPEAAKRQAAQQKQSDTRQKEIEGEWNRVKNTFRDGFSPPTAEGPRSTLCALLTPSA